MGKEQYFSVNHPEIFEFHDSRFELDCMDEKEIAVYVHGLNIFKDAEQNPKGYDLEIKLAHIRFYGISEFTYDPGRTWKTDENGNSIPIGQEVIYHGEEAFKRFRNDLQVGAEIFSHTIVDGDYYELYGLGSEPFFLVRFKASRIVIRWDDYLGPAWYELRKQFNRKLTLNTPNGEMCTDAHFIINYDSDELYNADDKNDVDWKDISIGIEYKDKKYWGRGTDCSGQDAFADLQKQLPDGVFLKCCLSCRHGNQSPFSNAFDSLYCMKDRIITEKSDLCHYTTDVGEVNKRGRCYTDICEDWAEQRDDMFVYSDYPNYLRNR